MSTTARSTFNLFSGRSGGSWQGVANHLGQQVGHRRLGRVTGTVRDSAGEGEGGGGVWWSSGISGWQQEEASCPSASCVISIADLGLAACILPRAPTTS